VVLTVAEALAWYLSLIYPFGYMSVTTNGKPLYHLYLIFFWYTHNFILCARHNKITQNIYIHIHMHI
jgi:hypothetical protein